MTDTDSLFNAIRGINLKDAADATGKDIRHVKEGSYLETDEDTYLIKRIFYYLDVKWKNFAPRKKDYWVTEFELLSLTTGNITYVEWEEDDELEVYETIKAIKLRDIQVISGSHGAGGTLTQGDLEYIAEEETGSLNHAGIKYHYSDDDTWAALFYRGNKEVTDVEKEHGSAVRIYEFEANDGTSLSVEAWHEEPDEKPEREAFISKPVNATKYKVLQV